MGRKVEKAKSAKAASLNIKDPEVRRLAAAIAHETGETMTRVVAGALRDRYARLQQRKSRASLKELLAIADRAAALVRRPYRPHGDLLYGEHGLPK